MQTVTRNHTELSAETIVYGYTSYNGSVYLNKEIVPNAHGYTQSISETGEFVATKRGLIRRKRQPRPFKGVKFSLSQPVSIMKREISAGSGRLTGENSLQGWYKCHATGKLNVQYDTFTGFESRTNTVAPASIRDLAITSAYAKANSASMECGLMLAELKESLSMIRNPLLGAVKIARAFKRDVRKDLAHGRKIKHVDKTTAYKLLHATDQYGLSVLEMSYAGRMFASYLSDMWLSWNFGIAPLGRDIGDLMGLATYGLLRDTREVIRKKGKYDWPAEVSTSARVTSRPLFSIHNTVVSTYNVGATAGVAYTLQPLVSSAYQRMQDIGLGMDNLPSVFWEATPLSFVSDWFVNVGDWIRAVMPRPGVTFVDSYVSTKQTWDEVYKPLKVTMTAGASSTPGFMEGDLSMHLHAEKLIRIIKTPVPAHPVLNRQAQNLFQEATELALIWQKLPGFFKTK